MLALDGSAQSMHTFRMKNLSSLKDKTLSCPVCITNKGINKYPVLAMQQGGHRTERTSPSGTEVAFPGSWQMHRTIWAM